MNAGCAGGSCLRPVLFAESLTGLSASYNSGSPDASQSVGFGGSGSGSGSDVHHPVS